MAENNKRLVAAGSAILVLAAAAGTAALFLREHNAQARQADILQKELAQGPTVRAARVEMAAADRVVSLPAEVRAEMHATLYAKVSGYVKEVTVDKGDRVSKGQVVAVLESPDLDEQLRSAEAELSLRKQQLARALRLVGSGYVSHDQREQIEEAVKVAQANVVRARVQKDYQFLRAPFDGTVTARYADPGALLPAATGSTSSAQPLLEIAQVDRLRLALQLGQDDASRVHTGDAVTLQLARVQCLDATLRAHRHRGEPRSAHQDHALRDRSAPSAARPLSRRLRRDDAGLARRASAAGAHRGAGRTVGTALRRAHRGEQGPLPARQARHRRRCPRRSARRPSRRRAGGAQPRARRRRRQLGANPRRETEDRAVVARILL